MTAFHRCITGLILGMAFTICPLVQPVAAQGIPEDIDWLTNDTDPVFSADNAKKGGTLRTSILSFPLTFRTVGPDSNSGFRGAILGNQYALIGIHPNTLKIIPEIATHWAFGKDKRTMYFRLNPSAKWSDGVPVTAHDFAYTLDFMRSKHIVAPWYNDYYTKEIEKVVVYDDLTLAVVATKAQPDLHLSIGITPTPRHFYGELTQGFVQTHNWKIVPNTGPYQMSSFQKGKHLTFLRKKDWWGQNLRYYKHRFNVDKVKYTVVKDINVLWEHFKKAKIDVFGVTMPKYWHVKTMIPIFEKGYAEKIWFFNDTQQSASGMWLNEDREIFRDRDLRYAFAHAMNIQKVIEKVLRNDYFRLEHGYMGYGKYSNNGIQARRFDLDRVEFYMKNAGWARGGDGIWTKGNRRFSVEVTYSSDDHTPRLVVLKEEAKKAGIELKLRRLDQSADYKTVFEKKHDVSWMGWSTSLRPRFWEHYHSINAHKPQTNNITNTDDPVLDELIDIYRNSLDPEERVALARRIQEKIYEVGSFVPTFMVPYVREAFWRWLRLPNVPGTKRSGSLFSPFDSTRGGLFWFDKQRYDETKAAMKKKRSFPPVTLVDDTYKNDAVEVGEALLLRGKTILKIENLVTEFDTENGRIRAVDDVSFDVKGGRTCGIVGESGCGKSVTALSIMRLLPRPTGYIKGGRILFGDTDLVSLPTEEMHQIRGNRIAMIFQEPMTALNPVQKIGKQMREVFRLHSADMGNDEIRERSLGMLHRVGIPDPPERVKEYSHQISGGMRQRVMIAMALSARPDILIADEPTTALDVTIQAQILAIIQDLQKETGMSVIFITHDLGVIAEICDDVVVMYAGKIAETATVLELFENPRHPYTKGLLDSIPRLDSKRKSRLRIIEGTVPALDEMPRGCRFENRCPDAMEICGTEPRRLPKWGIPIPFSVISIKAPPRGKRLSV